MSYEIVVPSARRAETFSTKTLPLLERLGVKPNRITLVLPSQAELQEYAPAMGGLERVGRIVVVDHEPEHSTLEDIGIRPHNLGVARNAVLSMFPAGTQVLQMDDDLSELLTCDGPKSLRPITDLDNVAEAAFDLAASMGLGMWGIYAVKNPFFMKDRAQVGLVYGVGCMFGITLRGDQEYERVVLDDKEDFERSIRYAREEGGILRFDNLTVTTSYYKGSGGLQASRTADRVSAGARWLAETFPGYCEINHRKKSDWAEVRLRPAQGVAVRKEQIPWKW